MNSHTSFWESIESARTFYTYRCTSHAPISHRIQENFNNLHCRAKQKGRISTDNDPEKRIIVILLQRYKRTSSPDYDFWDTLFWSDSVKP